MKIKINNEFDSVLPPLSEEDYKSLEESLLKNGFKYGKIQLWIPPDSKEDTAFIVDGHNRYRICQKHGILVKETDYEILAFSNKDEVKIFIYQNQLARRNLSLTDRYIAVQKYQTLLKKQAKANQSNAGKGLSNLTKVNTRKELAKMLGISDGTYQQLKSVMESDNENVKQQLKNKEISVYAAYNMIKAKCKESYTDKIESIDEQIQECEQIINKYKLRRDELLVE